MAQWSSSSVPVLILAELMRCDMDMLVPVLHGRADVALHRLLHLGQHLLDPRLTGGGLINNK